MFTNLLNKIETLESNYKARCVRVEAAFKEGNSNLIPSEDSKGRLHAPCDGYVLPESYADMLEGDYSEKIFAAGEYLPMPIVDEEHYYNRMNKIDNLTIYKRKVKTTVESVSILNLMDVYRLNVGSGKSWEENGVEVCYAYLEGMRGLVDSSVLDLEEAYKQAKSINPEPEFYLEGKHTITPVIVMTKIQNDDMYGPGYKMMVKTSAGHKLYGTLPKSIPFESEGRTITFSGTFKPGKNGLSYFSRPTAASLN